MAAQSALHAALARERGLARISQEKYCFPICYLLSPCASGHFLQVCTFYINSVIYLLPGAVVELSTPGRLYLARAVQGDPCLRKEIGLVVIESHLGGV